MDILLVNPPPGKGDTIDGEMFESANQLAKQMAEWISVRYHSNLIYTSPAPTALVTAQLMASFSGTPISRCHALADLGRGMINDYQDKTSAPYPHPEFLHYIHHHPRGGESILQAHQRLAEFCATLHQSHANDCVTLVTHQTPISIILRHMLSLNVASAIDFYTDFGSVSHLYLNDRYIRLVRLNSQEHINRTRLR